MQRDRAWGDDEDEEYEVSILLIFIDSLFIFLCFRLL